MASGVLVSMAASPPVAARIGIDTFHFIKGQLFYLCFAVPVLVALSFFPPRLARRAGLAVFFGALCLMVLALCFGPEIKGAKHPHWTATRNSSTTFGHFGGSGTFVWVDPVANVACFALADREFDEWALSAWPAFGDAVLHELGR
jgi:hypothetical protein